MAVCSRTGLPVAWQTRTAKANESSFALPLLDAARERGFNIETCAMDKGYDLGPLYDGCEDRGIRPIVPLRQTPAVARGNHQPPSCEHGEWRFAGSDSKRGASKWRCPTGDCKPTSRWIRADRLHPLVPRETLRWRKLYKGRASVEREFGRLKARVGTAPAARAWHRARAASRRPHDPRQASLRARPCAGYAASCIARQHQAHP
jgi:DDE family transposase